MCPVMAWTESQSPVVGNVREPDATGVSNEHLKGGQPDRTMSHSMNSNSTSAPSQTIALPASSPLRKFQGKDALAYANILRSRNKFVDALALYETVLETEPGNVEAHIGKGICLQMQGMIQQAFRSFADASGLDPQNACALTHCGILFKDEGHLLQAAEAYQKALVVDPTYKPAAEYLAIVLTDIGTSLKLAGNVQEGIQKYHEALKADSRYAPAYYNLGVVYSEMMQYDMALNCYEKAALQRPMYAEAYCNMGVIYKNRGDLDAAIACYERCLAVSPNFEIAKNNMAIALTDLGTKVKLEGDIHQGIAHYKKALLYNWHYADAMYNLGVAYGELLKLDMAIVMYELALHFNPHCAEACNNLGVIYKDRDNLDKAVECYQMALTIKPSFSQSLNNLGVVYTVQGKMDAAASMIEKAIMANPTYAEAYNNLGVLHRDAGNITLAIEAYERCLQIDPDSRNAGQNRLLAMNYIYEGEDDKLYIAHREWGKRFMSLYPQYTVWDNLKDPDRVLVIGYVSPDYFTHSVSYFVEAPLLYHDNTKYKVVVYSAVVKADAKTHKFKERVLKKGGIWRDIYGIDEKKVASIVREDKVDILVELTGHTANNRLGMMACRPAPVQVTWIGYPNTTGLPTIDYRFTDSLADPPNTKQKHVEELVRLPGCFLCYTPSPEAGPIVPTPALSNGFITFGSFNNLAKITPRVLRVWAKILCAIPTSRLVVKCKPFCCDSVRQRFLSTLEELGLESLRVDLLPLILLNHDHMQAYSLMDISLDTFPYAGTTTTCESLYMGVPCVTMAGSVHAHNVGVSLLHQVGLEKLIAQNEDEYISKALELASDIPALSALRTSLRDRMLRSQLCDGPNFVQGLESTYQNLWHRYCEGDVPSLKRYNVENLSERPTTNSDSSVRDTHNDTNVKEVSPSNSSLVNGVNSTLFPLSIFSSSEGNMNGGSRPAKQ
uniref:Probable UDP-N-acetylglucosamine--peptide N-acetylglucosaminyltransferase SPINDLY n=1 Tax=Wollemia nobilis TaxID=56998 RepID=A0A0C9RQE7_9CONI